jgi:hypothetical protein
MKNALRTVMLVSLFLPMATMAQTTDCNFVYLDENGNGSYYTEASKSYTYFTGSLTPDPSGGALGGLALVYTLPFDFTLWGVSQTGDYVLTEAEDTNIISDVVRFWGTNQVIFYSSNTDVDDPENPPSDLADVSGLPVNSLTPSVLCPHPSPESYPFYPWEGVYGPAPGDPGYAELNLVYVFESIPEPSTLALAGLGLAGLALMAHRRRSK